MPTPNRRRICGWCAKELAPGFEPATHGICDPCIRAYFPDHDDAPPELVADPFPPKADDWKAGAALVLLILILLFGFGCDSPVRPTPPPPVCVLEHHPDLTACVTIFTPSGPILQCHLTPAHDGPELVCQ